MPGKRKWLATLAILSPAAMFLSPAGTQSVRPAQQCVRPDATMNAAFHADGPGWIGGDGAQSVKVGDRTIWLFADSFVGTVAREGPYLAGAQMIRNAALERTRSGARLLHAGRSLIQTQNEWIRWYWPGDGIYERGEIRVPVYTVARTDAFWPFQILGVSVARLSWPGLRLIELVRKPYRGVMWGLSLYPAEKWTYIYGWGDITKLYVARSRRGAIAGRWQYRTGRGGWSPNAADARPILTNATTASVVPYRGRFVLITQLPPLSRDIAMHVGATPYGPFGPARTIYRTPETGAVSYTYEATAHRVSRSRGLLVGYSVNAWNLASVVADSHVYRPRFIRVDLECALGGD